MSTVAQQVLVTEERFEKVRQLVSKYTETQCNKKDYESPLVLKERRQLGEFSKKLGVSESELEYTLARLEGELWILEA